MMILLTTPVSLPTSVVEFALSSGIKCTALLALVWLATTLWRRGSAAKRHAVIGSVILAVLMVPLASLLLPAWQVAPDGILLPTSMTQSLHEPASSALAPGPTELVSPEQTEVAVIDATSENTQFPGWLSLAMFVWLAGTGFFLTRLALGMIRTERLVGRAETVESVRVTEALKRCAIRLGVGREVRMVVSRETSIPYVWGWFRPTLVLPETVLHWSTARITAVFMHELAHVRRHDTLVSFLAGLVVALYWFNPLVWLLARRLHLEQERACDDCVIMAGTDACEYAGQLLAMSSTSNVHAVPVPGVALARGTQLGDRIVSIINAKQNRTRASAITLVIIAALTVGLTLPLASLASKPEVALDDVTQAELAVITATLSSFYDALNVGEDFRFIRESYLAGDYFDQADLTMENLDRSLWTNAFNNTLRMFKEEGLAGGLTVTTRIEAIRREGANYIVTQRLDLISDMVIVESVTETPDGLSRKVARDAETGEPITEIGYVVNSLEQEIIVTIEEGEWKIASYNDGLRIMQMDTERPYGPIFLVWVSDLGSATTPYGSMISKVIPNEYRPFNSLGITFSLVE